jgi:hypothetical protein
VHQRGNPTRVSITDDAHPSALSEGGRLAVEPVAGSLRNQWPLSPGIPGRLAAEYAIKVEDARGTYEFADPVLRAYVKLRR